MTAIQPFQSSKPAHGERLFADMAEARRRLDISESKIMERIENLELSWAFNFATKAGKIFLRIYEPSLTFCRDAKTPLPKSLDELLRTLFPKANFTAGITSTITGVEFQRVFNLSAANVTQLLDAGLILTAEGNRRMGASQRILLPSVIAFLKARQLP